MSPAALNLWLNHRRLKENKNKFSYTICNEYVNFFITQEISLNDITLLMFIRSLTKIYFLLLMVLSSSPRTECLLCSTVYFWRNVKPFIKLLSFSRKREMDTKNYLLNTQKYTPSYHIYLSNLKFEPSGGNWLLICRKKFNVQTETQKSYCSNLRHIRKS